MQIRQPRAFNNDVCTCNSGVTLWQSFVERWQLDRQQSVLAKRRCTFEWVIKDSSQTITKREVSLDQNVAATKIRQC